MSDHAQSLTQVDVVTDHAPVKRLSCVETLRERRGEVVCFTPALLVTVGQMPYDPAQEFIARFPAPADKQPFCIELPPGPNRFFNGLGSSVISGKTIDWDRRLYAVPAERAQLCFDFLGGIGVHSGDFYASAIDYQLEIPDPTLPFATNGAVIPVHIFGVLIGDRVAYLAPDYANQPSLAFGDAADHIPGFKKNPVTLHDLKRLRGEA
jgi:hypothetical protein